MYASIACAAARDVAVLAPLAQQHAQHPLLGVDVVGREVAQLGDADPRAVERLEHRAVAQPAGRLRVGRLEDPSHLLQGQDRPRQALLEPRQLDVGARVVEQVSAAVEEAEEVLEDHEARPLVRRRVGLPVFAAKGVQVGLIGVEILRLDLQEVEASSAKPLEKGMDVGHVRGRRAGRVADVEVVLVQLQQLLDLPGVRR
jgi:hypothetical protein